MTVYSGIKGCILIGLIAMLSACSNIIDENPKDQVLASNFFSSENDAMAAVNGIYSILGSTSDFYGGCAGVYHSNYWVLQGLASDNMTNELVGAVDYDRLEIFSYTSTNSIVLDLWIKSYQAISYANFAIEGIPDTPMDDVLRERLLGEARFLRGLLYFELVRVFGEIPLVLPETQYLLTPEKASVGELYELILKDLLFAKDVLPQSYPIRNGMGRATQGAAFALLGEVYLTKKDYSDAVDYYKQVVDLGVYQLWPNFADAFNLENEDGQESVFSIGFSDGGGSIHFCEVGQFNVRLLPRELNQQIPGVNAQGWQRPTQTLYDQFDPLDQRRKVTFITEIQNITSGSTVTIPSHISKYWDRINEPEAGNTYQDFQRIRYSGVLLAYAEALNEANSGPTAEAYSAINTVRKRARFDGTVEQNILPDLVGLNYTDFKEAVLHERRLELVGEGKRWFDLVRNDVLVKKVLEEKPNAIVQDYHKLFPIPQREVDLNPNLLPQNTGY